MGRPPKTQTLEKPKIHYDEVFGVRVLREGQFRGLWELTRLTDNGEIKQVLTDANSRGMILTMMNRAVMKIVVQM